MRIGSGVLAALGATFLFASLASAQTTPDDGIPRISLRVPTGAPLRLYLTKRVSKRVGAPIEAKLLEPVFAFDREVIPAGTVVLGQVSRTEPVSKWQRVQAILNGDFTPLRRAQAEFTALRLPDGREISTHTVETMGLNSIYIEPSKKKKNQKLKHRTQTAAF